MWADETSEVNMQVFGHTVVSTIIIITINA